ncbi:hypothetical protein D3C71_1362940 [compost metagenome]
MDDKNTQIVILIDYFSGKAKHWDLTLCAIEIILFGPAKIALRQTAGSFLLVKIRKVPELDVALPFTWDRVIHIQVNPLNQRNRIGQIRECAFNTCTSAVPLKIILPVQEEISQLAVAGAGQ